MTQDNSQQNDSTMQQNSSTPEHKQNNSSITSSTNITEETKQDWNDFWYNSESEGKESKPQHLSEYVDHLTEDNPYPPKYKRESPLSEWISLSTKEFNTKNTKGLYHSSIKDTSPFVLVREIKHQKNNHTQNNQNTNAIC